MTETKTLKDLAPLLTKCSRELGENGVSPREIADFLFSNAAGLILHEEGKDGLNEWHAEAVINISAIFTALGHDMSNTDWLILGTDSF